MVVCGVVLESVGDGYHRSIVTQSYCRFVVTENFVSKIEGSW